MLPAQINRPGALRLADGRRLTFVETGPADGAASGTIFDRVAE